MDQLIAAELKFYELQCDVLSLKKLKLARELHLDDDELEKVLKSEP